MADNDYHFITTWRIENATLAEVTDILGNAEDLPRWWPSVYLDVKVVEPGGPDGVGRLVELYTKGWLPYTLRWSFRVKEATATVKSLREQLVTFTEKSIRPRISDVANAVAGLFSDAAIGNSDTALKTAQELRDLTLASSTAALAVGAEGWDRQRVLDLLT